MTSEKPILLTEEQYKKLCSNVKQDNLILSSGFVKLYKALNNEWRFQLTGIISIIKDKFRKKYILGLFEADDFQKTWEVVIDKSFRYNVDYQQLHTFSTGEDMYLFSFANYDESLMFSKHIKLLIKRKNDKLERSRQIIRNYLNNEISNLKKKLSKDNISSPSEFKHLDHISMTNSFLQNPNDEELKNILKELNMEYLLDNLRRSQDFYDFDDNENEANEMQKVITSNCRSPTLNDIKHLFKYPEDEYMKKTFNNDISNRPNVSNNNDLQDSNDIVLKSFLKDNQLNHLIQNTISGMKSSNNNDKEKDQDKSARKKLTKKDIGTPSDFRHVDHMGIKDSFFESNDNQEIQNDLNVGDFSNDKIDEMENNEDEIQNDLVTESTSTGSHQLGTNDSSTKLSTTKNNLNLPIPINSPPQIPSFNIISSTPDTQPKINTPISDSSSINSQSSPSIKRPVNQPPPIPVFQIDSLTSKPLSASVSTKRNSLKVEEPSKSLILRTNNNSTLPFPIVSNLNNLAK